MPTSRQPEPGIDAIRAVFDAAAEAPRGLDDRLRILLAGALAIADASVALVAHADGTIMASATRGRGDEDDTLALAAEAMQARVPESFGDASYIATLGPELRFAVRWNAGRSVKHRLARAVGMSFGRLFAREAEGVATVPDPSADALTGLPGRAAVIRTLDEALAGAQRTGKRVGVLFIDLDGFKAVNDSFGHAVGDQTLVEAGRRMTEALRRGDSLGRYGGDEFVALLSIDEDEIEMAEAAQRFLERVVIDVEEGDVRLTVRTSIGVAVFPDDGTTQAELLRHADEALYAAKQLGGGRVRWYRDGVGHAVNARREFRAGLRSADFERDFLLCFQPIVSTRSNRVVGAEALIRWRHPQRGWLAPRTFLADGAAVASSALDVKVIRAVGDVLRTTGDGRVDVRIHINVSSWSEEVWNELDTLFSEVEDATGRLALEVREATALADIDAGGTFLRRVGRLGVPIGIDGFGTTHTSLQALAALPLDFIKINPRAALRGTNGTTGTNGAVPTNDVQWTRVASAAVAVARGLNVRAIAEGVEDREQAQWLIANGVEQLQGYLIAQPMTTPDFADWLGSGHARAFGGW
jgi:diguanylate cyclase (GGDEF)-like protein